jgi:hypothetical protein
LHGFVVQGPEQQVFETVPQLVAGGLGIDEGVQREQGKRLKERLVGILNHSSFR